MESGMDFLREDEVSDTYNSVKALVKNDELYMKHPSGDFEYDFANGFRIHFLTEDIAYHLCVSDKNGNVIFTRVILPEKDTIYAYSKVYYIDYAVSVARYEYCVPENPPFAILKYNPDNKPINIFISYNFKRSGLGDSIAWLNSCLYFAEKYPKAKINVVLNDNSLEYFFNNYTNLKDYKNITLINYIDALETPAYANYFIAYFNLATLNDSKERYNYYKVSNCFDGLLKAGLDILGIDEIDGYKEKPKLKIINIERKKPKKPYVCIASSASSFYKRWLNKDGWVKVIDYLKSIGYDVYDIDKFNMEQYNSLIIAGIPPNAIDDTGNIPIHKRVERIINADFFIGLGSGLSWVAWLCDIPIVLISGFSKPKSEFYTPYRVINYNVCNGCWNELNHDWKANSCCPIYGNNLNHEKFLICSFAIRSESVIKTINKIPCVQEKINA